MPNFVEKLKKISKGTLSCYKDGFKTNLTLLYLPDRAYRNGCGIMKQDLLVKRWLAVFFKSQAQVYEIGLSDKILKIEYGYYISPTPSWIHGVR